MRYGMKKLPIFLLMDVLNVRGQLGMELKPKERV